ncbi:LysR family transcriptional regulator (plasmid) [Methylobacterium currus]|uniref:LysR substrate-binding domain-containing protein n=1 Tax=Methylobacterium currus TaxID=2051553 RepID=UPI001E502C84|nr:LysR substrate-binding domain-containing protein [Methylobacterium currus]UHC20181.1 LysR family transcriptional regulator [Methylobacterium currus]
MQSRYLDQRLKLAHLRLVDALETHRSLLRAATILGVTQPALTKSLHEIEDILQARLFERHARGVRPTETGMVLVRAARRILAEVRALGEELDRQAGADGASVSIGALPVAAAGILPGALARLKAEHPEIRVDLQQGRTEELLPLLAAGEVDLVVGRLYAPAHPDSFTREPLWSEPISVLARKGHPVLSEPAAIERLRRYEILLPTVSQRVGQEIEEIMARLGLAPSASLRSSSPGFIREMLHATDLIAVMPRLMLAGDLLRGSLQVVPLPIAAPDRPAGLILPYDRPLPAGGRIFAACLRAHVGEITRAGLVDMTGGYSKAPKKR